MDRDDLVQCRVMTEPELREALLAAMRLKVHKVRMGRVTFYEAMSRGLDSFADKVAEQMTLAGIVFLKRPPVEGHKSPSEPKKE
jgi:hypothetical protein